MTNLSISAKIIYMSEKAEKFSPQPKIPKWIQEFRLYGIDDSHLDKLEEHGIAQAASDWVDQKRDFEIAMGQRLPNPLTDNIPKNRVVTVGHTFILPEQAAELSVHNFGQDDEGDSRLVDALWVIDYWYNSKGEVRSDATEVPLYAVNQNGKIVRNDILSDEQMEVVDELIEDKLTAKYMTNAPEISIPDMDDTLTDVPN